MGEFNRGRRASFGKTIKVINLITGREDYHEGVSNYDISWIKANPNLSVAVLEVNLNEANDKRR